MTLEHCRKKLYPFVQNEGDPLFELAPCDRLPAGLPDSWQAILRAGNPVRSVLDDVWRPWQSLLPDTLAQLERKLRAIGLLQTRATPFSLIYVFENKGEPKFRQGFPTRPIQREEAKLLPRDFLDLYRLHDGWTDMNGFMGPLPSEDWFDFTYILDEEYSRILPGVRLRDFLIVCNSGGTDYLGYDLSKSPPVGLVCSTVDPVEVVPDVVRTLDEWMSVDLGDLE